MAEDITWQMFMSRHERPSVAVDVVVFRLHEGRLKVLLINRRNPPFQRMWAIPGGFVGINESLEDAARRELEEETGVHDVYLEQLYTFGAPNRDPRMRVISVVYYALIPQTQGDVRAGDDASQTEWYSVDSLPPLAFDHTTILTYAVKRLRYKLEYADVAFRILPDKFTLSALQSAYEIILGVSLDKRNFRRKLLQADILEETNEYRTGEGRPARLYRLRTNAQHEVTARRLFP